MDIYQIITQSRGGLVHQDGLIAGFDGHDQVRIWQPAEVGRLSKGASAGNFSQVAQLEWSGLVDQADARILARMLDRFLFPWEATYARKSGPAGREDPELSKSFISLQATAEYVFGQVAGGYKDAERLLSLEDVIRRMGAQDLRSAGQAYAWFIDER